MRREVGEEGVDLEGAGEAAADAGGDGGAGHVLAGEQDAAGVGGELAGDQVDERGLAGAVRADQRVAGAGAAG